jgi:flavin-dependent dehydrogenase
VARFDVIIAGAGVAGAIAAYTAARLGLRTAMIGTTASQPPGEGLHHDAAAVLMRLGLGHLLGQVHHVRCRGISHVAAGKNSFHPWPGFILDRPKFGSDVVAAAAEAGCERFAGEVFRAAAGGRAGDASVRIRTKTRWAEIRAPVVVDATGRKAVVARQLGARRKVLTNLAAAWAQLPMEAIPADPGTLAVEAVGKHWWYVAAGRRGMAAAVLGRRPPREPGAWMAAARATSVLAALQPSTPVRPVMHSANVSVLEPACGDGWLACGDAAATFDPLSGYGLAFAIGTGYAAARATGALLRGEHFASELYGDLVSERIGRAWAGLEEAYRGLAASPVDFASARAPVPAPVISPNRTSVLP